MIDFSWEFLIVAISVTVVFGIAIRGFIQTKTAGWGPFSTSTMLLLLILFLAAIALASGRAQWADISGLLLAVAGYAGGLFAKKES